MQEPGRYTIREEIASGSTATVYLAEDGVLRRKVALKKLHPHLLNHPETVKRFEKEAVAVASLSHENIIRVYDFGNQARNQYLAMEYVDGASLESLLAGGRPLPNRVCLTVMRQLMNGLAAAHDAGIVHRDIKPSNLLVDRKGRVRIADFGIAFLSEENHITKTGAYLGTPVYSAPEQARGLSASARSDIFSSGILLYRCLTGRLPFEGENSHAILSAILEKQPARPILYNRRLLPGLSELAERMLAKDAARRPAAAECLRELEAIAARHGLPIAPEPLRRFMEDPEAQAEAEDQELAAHFRSLARNAELGGNARMAVKLNAQAELYLEPWIPVAAIPPREAGPVLRNLPPRKRLALALGVLALFLVSLGAAWRLSRAPAREASATAPAPAALPGPAPAAPGERPAPVPPVLLPAQEPPAATAPAGFADAAPAPAARGPARPTPTPRPKPAPAPAPIAPPELPPAPAAVALPAPAEAPAPRPGFLLVKTNPPFALVTLDRHPLGITPFKVPVELPAGDHELLIEREGCLPLTARVRINAGETSQVRYILDKAQAASR